MLDAPDLLFKWQVALTMIRVFSKCIEMQNMADTLRKVSQQNINKETTVPHSLKYFLLIFSQKKD